MKMKILRKFILLFCLVTIPSIMVRGQSNQAATVGFFQTYDIPTDTIVEIPVEINDVNALYAIDFQMTFDPTILQVIDADPDNTGIQIAQATFLEAGMVLINDADNSMGTIRFITSQINPSEAKSGSGILFVIHFTGISEGTSALTITNLQLSDREGIEIPSSQTEDVINVSKDTQVTDSTPIPVLNPTEMIILEITPQIESTQATTPIPEATQVSSEDIQATKSVSDAAQPTQNIIDESTMNDKVPKFSLLDYWWIILILGVVVIGIGIYLYKTRKKDH